MPGFYIENFGCRATQADGAAIRHQFRQRGIPPAEGPGAAEWVVLNTCAVTGAAEHDARAALRRIRRANPACKIVITGCYAQRAPQEVAALPGVTQIIGNSHKHNLAEIALGRKSQKSSVESGSFVPLETLTDTGAPPFPRSLREGEDFEFGDDLELAKDGPRIFVSDIFAHTELLAAPVFDSANDRTRPNLKVQDGCNNRCSFCIIPSVRGRSRSLPQDEGLRQVNQLVLAGYREVVISGINLGRWGRDLHDSAESGVPRVSSVLGEVGTSDKLCLESLVRTILHRTSLQKLRISSVEPMDWTDSLIQLMAVSSRIAKHAHVPLQSGSDAVLRRMHRKYHPWHYCEKIEKIRDAMPTAAIGADVMVGFPGETDAEFEETRRIIEELPFTYLHVFTFSARPGTRAALMPNQVPVRVARERNRILRDLGAEKKLAFMTSFVGRPLQTITLSTTCENADGTWTDALTDNYLKMKVRGRHEPNRWIWALVESVKDGQVIATGSSATSGTADEPAGEGRNFCFTEQQQTFS